MLDLIVRGGHMYHRGSGAFYMPGSDLSEGMGETVPCPIYERRATVAPTRPVVAKPVISESEHQKRMDEIDAAYGLRATGPAADPTMDAIDKFYQLKR